MPPTTEDPDDAVVVYVAERERDLDLARHVIERRGIAALRTWRPSRPSYSGGIVRDGRGELSVARRDETVARQALAAGEAEAERRIREHTRGLGRVLRRAALVAALVALTLTGVWARHKPVALWALGGLVLVLGLCELWGSLFRARRSVPPLPPEPKNSWFPSESRRKRRR